jgi:hypothetical protein
VSGYVRAQRGRFAHHLFAREKFCRGYAWDWMVAQARFADCAASIAGKTVCLRRGQFTHSVRFMADVWNWDKAAVARFLARLKTESMIETETDTGQLIVTICNYDQYQADARPTDTATDTATDTPARQQRDSSETKNKNDERRKEGSSLESTRKRAPRNPEISIPENWCPSDRNVADATVRGFSQQEIDSEADRFRDHHLARGSSFRNWDAAWRTWLGNARRFSAGGSVARFPNPGPGRHGSSMASIAARRRAQAAV